MPTLKADTSSSDTSTPSDPNTSHIPTKLFASPSRDHFPFTNPTSNPTPSTSSPPLAPSVAP